MRERYYLKKIRRGKGIIYHYRLNKESGIVDEDETFYHTTGRSSKPKAREYVEDLIAKRKAQDASRGPVPLRRYSSGYFLWDNCPYIRRQHAKGKPFSEAHAKTRRGHLVNYILPKFGDISLQEINSVAVENWLIGLPLSNGTKNAILYTLGIILREAKREKVIEYNPVSDAERMADRYWQRDTFTLEEIQKLFPADEAELLKIWLKPKWAIMHYLMLTTGIRCGEVGALLWEHIAWDFHGIVIAQAIKANNTIGPTKSGDRRAVILPKRTENLLRWWYENTPFKELDDLVFFGQSAGQHLNPKTISRKIGPAMARAKILLGNRWLTAHSLRHTYNTRLEKLIPETILQYMIGHKSRAMTERYLHVTPEERLQELQETRKQLEVWN